MRIGTKSIERRCLLEVHDALMLMLGFGGFILTLLTFVLALIKHDKDQKK